MKHVLFLDSLFAIRKHSQGMDLRANLLSDAPLESGAYCFSNVIRVEKRGKEPPRRSKNSSSFPFGNFCWPPGRSGVEDISPK